MPLFMKVRKLFRTVLGPLSSRVKAATVLFPHYRPLIENTQEMSTDKQNLTQLSADLGSKSQHNLFAQ